MKNKIVLFIVLVSIFLYGCDKCRVITTENSGGGKTSTTYCE